MDGAELIIIVAAFVGIVSPLDNYMATLGFKRVG